MLLFSATLGKEIETLVRHYQSDPARHDVVTEESAAADVTHLFWRVSREDRVRLTADLVRQHGSALIFCRTRRGADRVARQLVAHEDLLSLRFEDDSLFVQTAKPDTFYGRLTEMAASDGSGEIMEVTSPDDNLQAVFDYLVKT